MNLIRACAAVVTLMLTGCGNDGATPANAAAADGAQTAPDRNAVVEVAAPVTAAPAIDPATVENRPTIDGSNGTGAAILRDILIAEGTLDTQPIRTVTLEERCTLIVASDTTRARIDWTRVGNFTGRTEAGRRVFMIDDGAGRHALAVPEGARPEPIGDAAARLDSGMGVLADTCQS